MLQKYLKIKTKYLIAKGGSSDNNHIFFSETQKDDLSNNNIFDCIGKCGSKGNINYEFFKDNNKDKVTISGNNIRETDIPSYFKFIDLSNNNIINIMHDYLYNKESLTHQEWRYFYFLRKIKLIKENKESVNNNSQNYDEFFIEINNSQRFSDSVYYNKNNENNINSLKILLTNFITEYFEKEIDIEEYQNYLINNFNKLYDFLQNNEDIKKILIKNNITKVSYKLLNCTPYTDIQGFYRTSKYYNMNKLNKILNMELLNEEIFKNLPENYQKDYEKCQALGFGLMGKYDNSCPKSNYKKKTIKT